MDGARQQGITNSNQKQRCFGFINKSHIDTCDSVKKKDSEEWCNKIQLTEVKNIKKTIRNM